MFHFSLCLSKLTFVLAFLRLKYPHLVWAAVSSSAPVGAIANFQGYNNVVAQSMGATSVGGSKQCQTAIKTAFAALGSKLASDTGRRALEKQFNLCGKNTLENPSNQMVFAENAQGVFPVQENDPHCDVQEEGPYCNIEKVCVAMLNASVGDELARLANLNVGGRYSPDDVRRLY